MALQSAEIVVVVVRGHEDELLATLAGFEVMGVAPWGEALRLLAGAQGLPPLPALRATAQEDRPPVAETA